MTKAIKAPQVADGEIFEEGTLHYLCSISTALEGAMFLLNESPQKHAESVMGILQLASARLMRITSEHTEQFLESTITKAA